MEIIGNEIKQQNLDDTVEWLTLQTPYRLAGSSDEKKAALHISDKLKHFGLDTTILNFYAYNSIPKDSSLEIIDTGKMLETLPFAHIKSTPPEGIMLDLVYLGSGSESDYEGVDIKGKAVLLEVSYAPPVPEKARIAANKGATAIVCMNWGNDEDVICHRGIKGVWGNPTETTFKQIPNIVGLGITRTDGLQLKNLCLEKGQVPIKINASSDQQWSQLNQPFGIIRGNGSSDEIIIVASHLDAWKPGVTCNATGNATTLEIARVLSNHKCDLARDIYFVFWSGHEVAEAAGSTWFLDNYWHDLNQRAVAYIHIDSTGVRGTNIFEIKASPELKQFAEANIHDSDANVKIRSTLLKRIGDQSFMGIGIPSITQRYSFTNQEILKANGATLGWWNHTKEDGLDKYDPDILYKDTVVTFNLIYKLAKEKVLPYSLDDVLNDIQSRLVQIDAKYSETFDFSLLISAFNEMRETVLTHNNFLVANNYQNKLNAYFIKLSRILSPVIQTRGGKYNQDSYGASVLSFPIPLLAEVTKLAEVKKGTLQYGLIETQLRRNFNEVLDNFLEVTNLTLLSKQALLCEKTSGNNLQE